MKFPKNNSLWSWNQFLRAQGKKIQSMSPSFLVIILIFFSFPFFAQEEREMIRLIDPNSTLKPQKKPGDDDKQKAISETQKVLLKKVLENLSDREIDDFLTRLGLSTEGSSYAKRIRLRESLQPKENKKSTAEEQVEASKNKTPYVIENAGEGEFLSIDKTKSGVLVLRGRVRIKVKEGTITADTISVDTKKNEIYAEGGINYKDGPVEIQGDKFIYDINNERGIIYDTKASMFPVNFIGKKIKKLEESKYLLDMGYFTTCNAEVPHYTFKAKKIFLYDDRSVIATDLWLNIGSSKVFWLPLYYGSSLGSGWIVQTGQNRNQGKFLQTSYQWSEPTAIQSLLSPVGRKIKIDGYEKTGQHLGFEFWKISPWLNYNLDLGIANYRFYQAAATYTDFNRFSLGGADQTVVTNQVDKGELCLETPGGKCIASYSSLLNAQNGFTGRLPDIGYRNETWWKGNLVLNAKSNNLGADGTRNVQIRMDEYSNPRFDFEFGYRYEPANTLQSLYTRRTQRNSFIRQTVLWNMDYTETRGDLSVNVSAKRLSTYFFINPIDRADFFPVRDELPRLSIRNSAQIGELPYFKSPVYWDFSLNTLVARIFGGPQKKPLVGSTITNPLNDPWGRYRENLLRTEYFNRAETGLRTNINLGSYFAYTPSVYIGGNKQSVDRANSTTDPTTQEVSIDRFYKRESYYFIRNNQRITYGIPELLFSSTYRRTDARNRELPDPVLKDGRDAVHEVELGVESNAFEDIELSLKTIRDMRQFSNNYNPQPTNSERWYFTIFRVGAYYDFFDGFKKNRGTLLEKQRSFFSGIFMNNDYVHHTAQNRPLYNNLTTGYQMGGFTLPFMRNIKSLEIGGTWYHVFNSSYMQSFGSYAPVSAVGVGNYYLNSSPFLDSYRYYIQADLQLNRFLGLEIELDSRVTQPWRYTNQSGDEAFYRNGQDAYTLASNYGSSTFQSVDPAFDLIGSTGIYGSNIKQNSAVNVYRLLTVLKHNLHNFEFRWGYSMDLRSIAGGASFDSQVTFYDQSLFFSVNLLNINLGADDATGSQSRARLWRYRKRPLDAGYRSSVSAE
jgi:hypothetical protein